MSEYALIADRARKAFASVTRLEAALIRAPEDRAIQMNLASMRRLAERERQELERIASARAIEICQYRLVPDSEGDYPLAGVTESLNQYQYLFSQIYDALRNGPKQNAIIGSDALKESQLHFAYAYSGSLGVALMVKGERSFFEGAFDKPIEALFQVLDIGSVDSVKAIAQTMGRAVVKRIHDWSSANARYGYSPEVVWKRSDGQLQGQMIDKRKLEKIVGYIVASEDTKTSSLTITGMLVAGSLNSKSFQIAVPGGETYSGHFDEPAKLGKMTLGKTYTAELTVSETYSPATDQTKREYKLTKLSS